MTTAREIMTPDAKCVDSSETVLDAARRMAVLTPRGWRYMRSLRWPSRRQRRPVP
jgi:hypothetical protein